MSVSVLSYLCVCHRSVVTACHTVCNCPIFLSISLSPSLPVLSAGRKMSIFSGLHRPDVTCMTEFLYVTYAPVCHIHGSLFVHPSDHTST